MPAEKVKISKWDYTKLKNLHTEKKSEKHKSNPWNGKKIFANHLSDKGLIPKIYKELIELKSKTINNPVKNWQRT